MRKKIIKIYISWSFRRASVANVPGKLSQMSVNEERRTAVVLIENKVHRFWKKKKLEQYLRKKKQKAPFQAVRNSRNQIQNNHVFKTNPDQGATAGGAGAGTPAKLLRNFLSSQSREALESVRIVFKVLVITCIRTSTIEYYVEKCAVQTVDS